MKRYLRSMIAMITVFSLCSTMIMEYGVLDVKANTSSVTSETIYVDEDFSSSTNYADIIKTENGWTATGTKWGIKDQSLRTTGSVSATCNTQFSNGYIESDIAIETPSSSFATSADGTMVYPTSLVARCSTSGEQEIRARFRVTKVTEGNYSVILQTVYYNKTDFGNNAVTYNYEIPNFEFGNSYNVKLACVGNYVEVSLNGVVKEQLCFKKNSAMDNHVGSFGILGAGGKVAARFDNVKIAECSTYQIQIADENKANVAVESFKDPKVATVTERNAFRAGETVKLITTPPEAMEVDTMKYTSEATGEVHILKGADEQFSFVMPAANIKIQSSFHKIQEVIYVDEDFSSSTNYADIIKSENGWTSTGTKWGINGQTLRTTGSVTATCNTQFSNGYIESDIAIETPSTSFATSADGTVVYPASLVARCSATGEQEIRVRFRVTKVAEGNYSVVLQTVYYNKTDFGKNAVTYDYEIPTFEFNKNYHVKLACVGNYVEVSLNGVVKEQFCFKKNSAMDTHVGSFGLLGAGGKVAARFDNVKIVKCSTYQVQVVEENKEYITVESYKDPKVSTMTARNAYRAGETVGLVVKPPKYMDVDVMSYSSSETGNVAISKGTDGAYSFVMPAINVLLNTTFKEVDDEDIVEMVFVDEKFDTSTDASQVFVKSNGWAGYTGTKPTIQNGKLYSANAFSANASVDFVDGYIESNITLEKPSNALTNATEKKTVYTGNMSARKTDSKHEIRSRFAITYDPDAKEYAVDLHTIYYDLEDYGEKAQFRAYSVPNFEFGKTYKVRLTTIGNYVEVSLNDIVVQQFCFTEGNNMIDREGSFGIATTKDSAEISFDNVRIVKSKTYSASVNNDATAFICLDSYADPAKTVKGLHPRNRFALGEFVMVNLTFPDGYVLEENSLVYKTESNKVAITEKDSDTLYAFKMPASAVVVDGELTQATTSTERIWFFDDFDEESLMTERGWNKNISIVNGQVYMDYNDIQDVQLTGISSATSWKNYIVECDLTLNRDTFQTSGCVAICLMNNSNKEGYEFGITSSTGPDAGYFRLYDRAAKEFLATSEAGTAIAGQQYHLMAAVNEERIECYVDGNLIFSVANPKSNSCGTIGLRMHKAVGLVDNVTVRVNDLPSNGIMSSPQTGDYSRFGFSLCMLAASGWVLAVALRKRTNCELGISEENK